MSNMFVYSQYCNYSFLYFIILLVYNFHTILLGGHDMNTTQKKPVNGLSREQEITASKFFGKHVTPLKALALFIIAVLVAAMPMIIGIHHYNEIPETVLTGIRDASGRDDSMPRPVLVYGIPALFTLLTVICHGQLWLHQKLQKLPKASIRLLGRWVMPVISLFLCTWIEHSAAGVAHSIAFMMGCIIGTALILVGAQVFDCKESSFFSLNYDYIKRNELTRRVSHRIVGSAFMLSGILILLPMMFTDAPVIASGIAALVIIVLSFISLPVVCRKIPHI